MSTNGLPLFSAPYPLSPGYARDSATSRGAAAAIAPGLRVLHTRVLTALLRFGPMTADEIAGRLGEHFMRIRPRCTELRKPNYGPLLERTGEHRLSSLGNPMDVVRLTDAGHQIAERLADVDAHATTIDAPRQQMHATGAR